eukprot:TRINITY_DN7478_c0_g5_i1.p1 TRINITY_DN7478_c0_g5~~TRINITY_DN7478_c0_g5_i1.p1  ORF type:complete len:615 (-),score=130.09 TRINITY_DN7478_c0_g5_i1:110-1954(-)
MTNIERHLAEKLAESLAQVAEDDSNLLSSGDPMKLVSPHLDNVEHRVLVKASEILLRRFHDTVDGKLPQLERMGAVAKQLALPALSKLGNCLTARRAFQAACTLTPLLNRAVVLASQCCALAIRGISEATIIMPLTRALTDMVEVFTAAILDRAELFRPFDAARISASHQHFVDQQAEAARAFSGSTQSSNRGKLAPPPARPTHDWRYDQLRKFWDTSCSHRSVDGTIPVDALAVLLIQAAGAEASIGNREAVMRRLHKLSSQNARSMSQAELDLCAPEMRRCGGLRAWVHCVMTQGGEETPRAAIAAASSTGTKSLNATWSSGLSGSTGMPLSARTTGSLWGTQRGGVTPTGKKPFVLSASFGRRPPTGRDDGSNPLVDSVSRGLLKASQRLVLGEKTPPTTRCGYHGDSALHIAAQQDLKHAPMASLLLSKGADANAEDRHLATPLHTAAASGRSHLARELLKHGADAGREDRWGATPLHKAADTGQAELAELLLKEGASVTTSDEWGYTALHRAAAHGQLAVAEKLLASHADANAEDRKGDRPLHVAAAHGDYAVVKLLLQHGGEATARSRVAGKTPEDYARDHGHTDVVTLLQHRKEWINVRSEALVSVP